MPLTAVQVSATLGLIEDPLKNKVIFTATQKEHFFELIAVFKEAQRQSKLLKPTTEDIWVEFLPWHSLN
ncbi:MAG: hypothetical protein ACKO34_01810 [Vampirovibrionales bacterium]